MGQCQFGCRSEPICWWPSLRDCLDFSLNAHHQRSRLINLLHIVPVGKRGSSLNFKATEFEFRYRFRFILGIYWAAFSLYYVGDENASVALARSIVGHRGVNSLSFNRYVNAFFVLGTSIAVLAALIRTWAGAYLHSSIIHDRALHSERLAADGPFRHLRNPLYLGTILLAVAIGTLASRVGFFVLSIGMILFVYRLILREEANLLKSQGENYRRYFEAVPRLIPSVLPRVPASGARADWTDGFVGEIFMWGLAAGMGVFALTGRLLYYWIVTGTGFAIYFLQNFFRSRKRDLVT
jgi:protein-S-isoprenylcysteine O-methyltransferase Ste14